jgi:hypothetical protein
LHLLSHQAQWPTGEIHRGSATWLASGITLEEVKIALLIDVQKLGKWLTDTQKLAVARRCNKLQGQLDEFVRLAVTFLSDELDSYNPLNGMAVMLDVGYSRFGQLGHHPRISIGQMRATNTIYWLSSILRLW